MKVPDDFLERGAFWTPHFLYATDAQLDKSERLMLTTLFALEDEFLRTQRGDWFFATNKAICQRSGLSLSGFRAIRERLRRKEFIGFRRGHTKRATDYRIRLDHFYRVWKEQERKTDTP